MLGKLAKYGILTVFGGIMAWFIARSTALFGILPDFKIISLISSIFIFLLVIAVKRGIWH